MAAIGPWIDMALRKRKYYFQIPGPPRGGCLGGAENQFTCAIHAREPPFNDMGDKPFEPQPQCLPFVFLHYIILHILL